MGNKFKLLFLNHQRVIENYFFMTVLQVLNSFFYLLIYPFVIQKIGTETYGMYIYAYSISMYFVAFVNFGFDLPGVNAVSLNQDNNKNKSEILSSVFTAKLFLAGVALIIFVILSFTIPIFRNNSILFSLCFFNVITNILFPVWYFQGIQKMKIVTVIQVFFKAVSLPAIFFLILSPKDINIYASIILCANIGGAISSYLLIVYKDKLTIEIKNFKSLKIWFNDALPFFWTVAAGNLKSQSIVVIIGSLFTKSDVAIYDLANKIISIPSTLVTNINGAIFPKLITNITSKKVRTVILIELAIGVLAIVFLYLFGYKIVILLGGITMVESYPMVIILSFTILSWLVVGAFISFIFIPNKLYNYSAKNQLIAVGSFFIYFFVGIFYYKNVYLLPISLSLSALTELAYCFFIAKRKNLL